VKIKSSIATDSSNGNFDFADTLSTRVTESPFIPSSKLMNTLIEIESSTFAESPFVSLCAIKVLVISSSMIISSTCIINPNRFKISSIVTESSI